MSKKPIAVYKTSHHSENPYGNRWHNALGRCLVHDEQHCANCHFRHTLDEAMKLNGLWVATGPKP